MDKNKFIHANLTKPTNLTKDRLHLHELSRSTPGLSPSIWSYPRLLKTSEIEFTFTCTFISLEIPK